jgi:predicted amidohydrolase
MSTSARSSLVRVGAAQLALEVGEVQRNLAAAGEAIAAAAAAGVGLLVLPELTNSGYLFGSAQEARSLAEPADGSAVTGWQQASAEHSMIVVAGFCELGDDARVYNSAVLIEDGRTRAVYRKAHLWDREREWFTPGSQRPPVVATSLGAVAMMICYDLEFPEWTRLAGLAGAELLAAPTNWPLAERPAGERAIEVVKVQAAAATNRMFVVAADRCGAERGVDWVGGSLIVDPDGYPLAGPVGKPVPALITAELDPAQARHKLLNDNNHVFDDRRSELYG